MNRTCTLLTAALLGLSFCSPVTAEDWLQFRGPQSSGVAPAGQNLPEIWNEATRQNIAWRADLPGRGLSAPLFVKDKIFLTACSGIQQDRLHVLCFSAKDGKELWQRQFWATGRTMCHQSMSVAANSPVSDGERIFAFYSTNDAVCLDLDGNVQWVRGITFDFPNASNSLGMASSPLVFGKTLVLQVENDAQSLALGLDVATGENRWKIDRPAKANWTSPIPLPGQNGAPDLVMLQSQQGLAAYNPQTGELVWNYPVDSSSIPSAVVSGGKIYLPSEGLTALEPQGPGQPPKVLWKDNRFTPATSSPVVYEGRVYTIARGGILKAADIASGEMQWQLRLKGSCSGTPIIADGKLYVFSDDGMGHVVELSPGKADKERLLSQCDLGERVLGTPAVAEQAMYVRSDGHLWKIAKTE